MSTSVAPIPATKTNGNGNGNGSKSLLGWLTAITPDSFVKVMAQAGAVGVICYLFFQLQASFVCITHEDRSMFQENLKTLREEHTSDRKELTSGMNRMSKSLDDTNQLSRDSLKLHQDMLREIQRSRRDASSPPSKGDGSFKGGL